MKIPKTIHAVDLFCGAGGTSQGLARACKDTGVEVDLVAINHWETAVNTHAQNHPWARHYCVPVESVNPREAFPGGRVDILCASPECTHHSTARGGKPTNDQLRASAWHIMRWVNELNVKNILIENVPEFEAWGPVSQKTGRPIKAQRGRYFRAFVEALSACGYAVQWRVLNAADYGDATSRRRLFLLARKGRRAPEWPQQSHSKVKDGRPSVAGTLPWRSARSIIDWTLKGDSIFSREERGLRPLAPKTIQRIIKGLERYGGDDLQPFLLSMASGGAPRSVDEPAPTFVAGGGGSLVEPILLPPDGPGGNGVHNHAQSVDEPMPTIRATRGGGHVVEPVLVDTFGSKDAYEARAKDVDEPVGTVAGNGRWAVAEPFIMASGGPAGQMEPRDVDRPLSTIISNTRLGVVEPVIVPYNGNSQAAPVDAPLPTATTVDRFGVAEPLILSTDRPGNNRSLAKPVSEPLPAILANTERIAIAEPFIVPHFGERDGQEPRTHGVEDPLPTVTGQGAGSLVEPMIQQLTHGGRSRDIDQPLPTITTAHRGELALVQPVIDGKMLDIRFRMLQPHELARAMGFGDEYEFVGNKRDIVKQIGNAVAVNMSQALISSLLLGGSDAQSRLPLAPTLQEAVEVA